MISKEMHEFLKRIPRHPNNIAFDELVRSYKLDGKAVMEIACEAKYGPHEYINVNGALDPQKSSKVSLTEQGQAEIEQYEQAMYNQKMIEKSLNVSRVAMIAAVASAVAAIASLIKIIL